MSKYDESLFPRMKEIKVIGKTIEDYLREIITTYNAETDKIVFNAINNTVEIKYPLIKINKEKLYELIDKANKYDEKETAKKVVNRHHKSFCPRCDFIAELPFDTPHEEHSFYFNYCPRCGCKLDWS